MLHKFFSGEHNAPGCIGLALIAAATGAGCLMQGLSEQRSVAHTEASGTIGTGSNIPAATATEAPTAEAFEPAVKLLDYSPPVAIDIPAVGISSRLAQVGKTADGEIDTPKHPDFDKAAWYRNSPTPGQYGVSVIVGHIDSYENGNAASVFYTLPRLRPGDTVATTRADGSKALFDVYAVREYPRESMQSQEIYELHAGEAELRLITCSGAFDNETGEYTDNTVIYAVMAGSPTGS